MGQQQLVALCADETSLAHPETMGLAGENLEAQPWLRLFTSAEAARAALRIARDIQEVWVVSCENVAPINLAATLKADKPERPVYMLCFQGSGSLNSRSATAGIDGQLSHQAFVARYIQWKQKAASMAQVPVVAAGASSYGSGAPSFAGNSNYRVGAHSSAGVSGNAGGMPSLAGASGSVGGMSSSAGAPRSAGGTPSLMGASGNVSDAHSFVRAQTVAGNASSALKASGSQVPTNYIFGAAVPVGHSPAPSTCAPASGPQPSAQVSVAAQGISAPGKTCLLPVVSGSGGAGKSTIAALLAQVAAASGIKTLLVDYDLQFGDMSHFLGEQNLVCIDEVLANPAAADRLVAQGIRPALLAAPKHMEDASLISERVPDLLKALSGKFDLIVFNTGAFWAEQHAALLERATKAVFLIDQRSSSLRACQHALDLCARLGIASGPFSFSLNKCTKGSPFTAIDASCALRGAHVYELRDGGSEVDELMEAAMMPSLLEENNPLVEDVRDMLAELLPSLGMMPRSADAGPGLANLLSKRTKKRKRGA